MIITDKIDTTDNAYSLPAKTEILSGTYNSINFATLYNSPKAIHAIAKETYCSELTRSYCNSIIKDFSFFYSKSALKPIIDAFAVKTHNDYNSYITVKDNDYDIFRGAMAVYYWYGRIEIGSKHYGVNDTKLSAVAIHEMTHSVMHYTFRNSCDPYYINDIVGKNSFEQAEKNTLINFYKAINLTNNVDEVNNKSSWQIGDIITKSEFWAKGYLTYQQKIIINKFNEVFSAGYKEEANHKEFIVRYYQLVAEGFSKESLSLLEPLANYIRNHINPAIESLLRSNTTTATLNITPDAYGKYAPTFALTDDENMNYIGEESALATIYA